MNSTRLEALPADSPELCDGHASGGTAALFTVILPSGKVLSLCGHHARRFGYDPATHPTYLTGEDKTKGSEIS